MAKTYEKISETKFRWSEERHHEGEIDAIEYLQHLADQLNTMRKLVANANTIQDQFLQIVEYYNQSREVLREAKEKLHLAVTVPEEIKLPECFSVIEVVPENLPKVSIARDEEKVEN